MSLGIALDETSNKDILRRGFGNENWRKFGRFIVLDSKLSKRKERKLNSWIRRSSTAGIVKVHVTRVCFDDKRVALGVRMSEELENFCKLKNPYLTVAAETIKSARHQKVCNLMNRSTKHARETPIDFWVTGTLMIVCSRILLARGKKRKKKTKNRGTKKRKINEQKILQIEDLSDDFFLPSLDSESENVLPFVRTSFPPPPGEEKHFQPTAAAPSESRTPSPDHPDFPTLYANFSPKKPKTQTLHPYFQF